MSSSSESTSGATKHARKYVLAFKYLIDVSIGNRRFYGEVNSQTTSSTSMPCSEVSNTHVDV